MFNWQLKLDRYIIKPNSNPFSSFLIGKSFLECFTNLVQLAQIVETRLFVRQSKKILKLIVVLS